MDATDEELVDASKRAQVHEFIAKLGDREIAERDTHDGIGLSRGTVS